MADNDKNFLAREKITEPTPTETENVDLPSVNRRKGGNKLITALGFMFILGVAAAMIVAVNRDDKPKNKKSAGVDEQITNNLPPLALPKLTPPPPPKIQLSESTPPPEAAPQAQAPVPQNSSKPSLDWTDRKMGGTLLIKMRDGNTTQNPALVRAQESGDEEQSTKGNPTVFAGQTGNSQNELAAKLEPTVTKGVSASLLPDRNFLITKGTSLDCALETALDSSVPGIATCRLTSDVYSDNGQVLLLDRGSQLVGEYQSGLKQGQVRLFVLWTRAKTPSGVIVSLNSPGTDALGRSGLEGWVDNHFMERFGAAILMSLLKEGVSTLKERKNQGGTTNYFGNSASGGEKIVEKILDSTVNIPPTIIKNQGDHIQVMAARDLDFSSVYALQVKK